MSVKEHSATDTFMMQGNSSLTITALLRTQDGTTVEGKMKRMSVVDGVNVYAGNVAKIGEQYYADFASALSAATSGATIELIKDAGYTNSTGNTLYLTKTIVVNGNGNQFNLTANGNYAVFEINDSEIDLTIKNADVVHGTKGMILRYKDSITTDKDTTGEGVLTLDNVNITSASSYQWCLFNLAQKAGTTRADFDNVDITWNGTHASTGSIIRTGNDLTNTRTVFADFNNCNFDTSGCTASNYLLYCATGTTTNVTLNNTFIDDKASYAINGESAAKTINSVSVKAWDTLNVACENIELASGEQLLNSKVAKTEVTDAEGNTTCTWYTDFSTAMDATKNAVGDVTLMMYQDSVHNPSSAYNIPDVEFEDKDLVIDGNDFTLTTQGSNNSFVVKQTDGSFTLKNMYIEHDSTAILARTDTAAKLYFEDLVVNADNYTEPVEGETADNTVYRYGLFNALNSYDTEMYFKNVDITLDVSNTPVSTDAPAVIRTGNTGDEKTVSIYLDGCNIDATRANTRAGIRVMNKTTANIYLKDTSILVQNNYSIYSYKNTEAYEKTINIYGDNVLLKRNDVPTDPSRGYIFTVNDNLDVSTWPLQ